MYKHGVSYLQTGQTPPAVTPGPLTLTNVFQLALPMFTAPQINRWQEGTSNPTHEDIRGHTPTQDTWT